MRNLCSNTFFIFVFAVSIFASAGTVSGCSYPNNPELPLEYRAAKTKKIFLGKVITKNNFYEKNESDKYLVQRVRFKVEKAFKGSSDNDVEEILFYEKVEKTSCDDFSVKPKVGEKWLIYAEYDGYHIRKEAVQFSFKYSKRRDKELIEKIKMMTSNPVTAIYGQVDDIDRGGFFSMPMENIRVHLEGNGVKRSTDTNESGIYSFENISADKYKVRILLPYNAANLMFYGPKLPFFDEQTQNYFFEYEVTIGEADTEYEYFLIKKINEKKETPE